MSASLFVIFVSALAPAPIFAFCLLAGLSGCPVLPRRSLDLRRLLNWCALASADACVPIWCFCSESWQLFARRCSPEETAQHARAARAAVFRPKRRPGTSSDGWARAGLRARRPTAAHAAAYH